MEKLKILARIEQLVNIFNTPTCQKTVKIIQNSKENVIYDDLKPREAAKFKTFELSLKKIFQ